MEAIIAATKIITNAMAMMRVNFLGIVTQSFPCPAATERMLFSTLERGSISSC